MSMQPLVLPITVLDSSKGDSGASLSGMADGSAFAGLLNQYLGSMPVYSVNPEDYGNALADFYKGYNAQDELALNTAAVMVMAAYPAMPLAIPVETTALTELNSSTLLVKHEVENVALLETEPALMLTVLPDVSPSQIKQNLPPSAVEVQTILPLSDDQHPVAILNGELSEETEPLPVLGDTKSVANHTAILSSPLMAALAAAEKANKTPAVTSVVVEKALSDDTVQALLLAQEDELDPTLVSTRFNATNANQTGWKEQKLTTLTETSLRERIENQQMDLSVNEAALAVAPGVSSGGISTENAVNQSVEVASKPIVTISTPLAEAAWPKAMAQQLVTLLDLRVDKAQIQLNPPQMGPIEITLKMNGLDQAQVLFTAAVPATRETLENHMPRLTAMMANQGIQLSDAHVSQDSSSSHQAYSDHMPERQANREWSPHYSAEIEIPSEPTYIRSSKEGISIFA